VRNERLFASLFTLLSLAPLTVTAQAPSRAVRVLSLLSPDVTGVLVTRDRVFVTDASMHPLSVCAGARCAAVVSSDTCAPPRCPGSATLLVLEHPIADVSDLPTDRVGFNHAMDVLRSDPALASISWSFGTHPDPAPAPPRWITRGRTDSFVWELGATAVGGVLAATGVTLTGGEVSGGFRFTWDARRDDEVLGMIFGTVIGADIRVRSLALFPSQSPTSWTVTIGIAPAMTYASRDDVFRVPTFYSILIPEFGVALREGRDPVWYAGWSLPFTFLIDEHLGFEARASALVVDDWIPGDDVEAILTLGLGLITP